MPVTRTCTFCGNDIEPGTGKMYIRKDGTTYFFCSGKCQKNMLHLGRIGRRVRWTQRYVRALRTGAPRRVAPAPREAPRAAPAAEVEAPEEEPEAAKPKAEAVPAADRETVIQAFEAIPGLRRALAEGLWDAGFTSLESLRDVDAARLQEVKGIGPATAKRVVAYVQEAGQ